MIGCYRVLVVEDDPDPTVYLRLVLLQTGGAPDQVPAEHPVRCHTRVKSMLNGITGTINGLPRVGAGNPAPPVILIVDAAHDRREALAAFFRSAGCTVSAVADADAYTEQPASLRAPIFPDLLVLPDRAGPTAHGVDNLRARYPHCQVAVTSVLESVNQP